MTDANVVLGYIPTGPLGAGDLTISSGLAEQAVARLGEQLGLSTVEAARGIHDLANGAMMRALRAVSTEKGRDPADFVLLAYGGSGPVHAAALAAELGARTAIVPPLAGLFSAAGLLYARAEFHDVRFCRVSAPRARSRAARAPRCRDARVAGRLDRRGDDRRVAASRRRSLPRSELERDDRLPRRARPRGFGRAWSSGSRTSTSGSTARGSSRARPLTSAPFG